VCDAEHSALSGPHGAVGRRGFVKRPVCYLAILRRPRETLWSMWFKKPGEKPGKPGKNPQCAVGADPDSPAVRRQENGQALG
jgi:hypothetical protein